MPEIAISVQNLGKSYLVGHNFARPEGYATLRDNLARNARSLARRTRDMFQGNPIVQGDVVEEFWALKDVSFTVKQGDRIGVIGRNGAGKSTLLKILSRITEPSIGRVEITGRVASLLEVGTGFHPELTGRENLFLNGAILGMSRREIQLKFDEIVDFAEIESFLDTPVKRYSSGMYIRLAFAIAAHLDPEILIVDEVLAVGDSQFQKRCLGKMEEVSKQGRTVLFVSHNMAAIEQLTRFSFLLDGGRLVRADLTNRCVKHYLTLGQSALEQRKVEFQGTSIEFNAVNDSDQRQTAFQCGSRIRFKFDCYSSTPIPNLDFQIVITSSTGVRLLTLSGRFQSLHRFTLKEQTVVYAIWSDSCLAPGEYFVSIAVYQDNQYRTHWDNLLKLDVLESNYYATGKMPDPGMGPILSDCRWEVQSLGARHR